MKLKTIIFAILVGLLLAVAYWVFKGKQEPLALVLRSDVSWEQLNPARGTKSPQAANLWGNRTKAGAAGFLLKPIDGFRSPPHIHNVSYRGIVISGLLHNDDPSAMDMWMPKASYWTQPAGGVHITAAKGEDVLAYIEVDDNFGVLPANKAFKDAEQPINVHASNIVWVSSNDISWINNESLEGNVEIAFLWNSKNDFKGKLIKFAKGTTASVISKQGEFKAVVIKGSPNYIKGGQSSSLEEGSYFYSEGKGKHKIIANEEVIIYTRTNAPYKIK